MTSLTNIAWLAPVVMLWNHIKAAAMRASSLMIVRSEVCGQLADRVHHVLYKEWQLIPLGVRLYQTEWEREKHHADIIPYTIWSIKGALVFRQGFKVIIWTPAAGGNAGTLVSMRFNVNQPAFLARCAREMYEQSSRAHQQARIERLGKGNGHYVARKYGTARREYGNTNSSGGDSIPSSSGDSPVSASATSITELGATYAAKYQRYPVLGPPIDLLGYDYSTAEVEKVFYLDPSLEVVVREVDTYLRGGQWMNERNIPHRRGVALTGPPGAGKSAFAQWLARRFQLPLIVPELATFVDQDLKNLRDDTRMDCIVLLEDFDAIFHGRKNVVDHDGMKLTFDAVLNLLSGVEALRCIVILTTNLPDQLDPALVRPGRIDRMINVPLLGREGREFLAGRIMRGMPQEDIDAMVALEDMPAAHFENKCIQAALAYYWNTNL